MQGPLAPLFGAGRFWPKLQKAPARAPAHQLVLLISIHVPYGVFKFWENPDWPLVVLRAFLCLWQNIWWAIRTKSISMCSFPRAGAFACYHFKMFWMMASSKNREGTIEVIVCSGRLSITLINLLVTAWIGHKNNKHQLVRQSTSWCFCLFIIIKGPWGPL